MYNVYGAFQNAGKQGTINYCEELLKECATLEEAKAFEKTQSGAWDNVIIRDENNTEY